MNLQCALSLALLLAVVAGTTASNFARHDNVTAAVAASKRKNVLFIFTDDQDKILHSLSVMPKLNKLVTAEGTSFENAFCNTPICCPSRAEVQTGRYMHNTKVIDNSCGGTAWQQGPEKLNIAHYAKQEGYQTYYSGKYLNNYGFDQVGGVKHIPDGWTDWHALVGNSKYYNYDVSDNGVKHHFGNDFATDYYTDKLKNDSVSWLKNEWNNDQHPFFMMIGTPCPHVPNEFAPQYADLFRDLKAPRVPNWNVAPANATGPGSKHWLMRHIGPMDQQHVNNSDMTFQDRWRCLQSVDDLVEEAIQTLQQKNALDDTYIVFSADHGQHLGSFGMGFDKRQLYETDVRVPLIVRGPGVPKNVSRNELAIHVDLAPTFLDMMSISRPSVMDGRSWLPIVTNQSSASSSWRNDFLIEYGGPSADTEADFERRNQLLQDRLRLTGSSDCGIGFDCNGVELCGGEHGSCPCDAVNNTYKCLRTLSDSENSIYCEFDDSEGFVEWYDINADPWEMNNLAETGPKEKKKELHDRLRAYMHCSGDNCFDPPPVPPEKLYQLQHSGSCLGCIGACEEGNNLRLDKCSAAGAGSAWRFINDTFGYIEIEAIDTGVPGQCLNVLDRECSTSAVVHLHACQGQDTQPHLSNRMKFDADKGAIESTYCPGFCVAANMTSATLVSCKETAAQGWKAVDIST